MVLYISLHHAFGCAAHILWDAQVRCVAGEFASGAYSMVKLGVGHQDKG